jgi:hypothetical protein
MKPRILPAILAILAAPLAGEAPSLELTRPVRPWELLVATGAKGALLGQENGRFEAWIYPLKLVKDVHLRFRTGGQVLEGEALARSLTARPEGTTLTYAWDTFRVRETLLVPPSEPGALVRLDIETSQPLEVEAVFTRDFQLLWPAALGGQDQEWAPALKAFRFSEPAGRFAAVVGSPDAVEARGEAFTNQASNLEDTLRLASVPPGQATRTLVLAASCQGDADAEATYRRLAADPAGFQSRAAAWYAQRLDDTVALDLPDPQIQRAYDWSRVSLVQALADNPLLGQGLLAGFRASGPDYRPCYAWFFGRDALWTVLALDSLGDFPTSRAALTFLARYQREDGKIPHEISHSASLVTWFKDRPWAYAAADATPLFLIAAADYVERSGDTAFAREMWKPLEQAHRYLRGTWNAQGLPRNQEFGTGWVEGGPLFTVETEFYQSAVGLEAERALGRLAQATGREALAREQARVFEKGRVALERAFWLPEAGRYAFGIKAGGAPLEVPSVLATVPMGFGLLDETHANRMIDVLAGPDHQTDWGMRILSARDPRYEPEGYHSGSVWPLFTGWAALGEYRAHRAIPAYGNLRSNALLALDGCAGHVAEVLTGDRYQTLATGCPSQVWSSAMVVSPLLAGLLGLDAQVGQLIIAPHLPADWNHVGVRNLRAGACRVDLRLERDEAGLRLDLQPRTAGTCQVTFAPALAPGARVLGVTVDGRETPFTLETHACDQHVRVALALAGAARRVVIRTRGDFGLAIGDGLPELGGVSRALRVQRESWEPGRCEFTFAGPAGGEDSFALLNPGRVTGVEGASLEKGRLRVVLPPSERSTRVILHLKQGEEP